MIPLDPHLDRTGDYWYVQLPGLAPGQLYAWRARGPVDPARSLRCHDDKVLLDPYGRAVAVPGGYRRAAAPLPCANPAQAAKNVVVDTGRYDRKGDRSLRWPGWPTTELTRRSRFLRRMPVTPRRQPPRRGRWRCSTSFATGSRRCTAPASR